MDLKIENPDARDWRSYDRGRTVGKPGPEGGIILDDQENVHGARITVEQLEKPQPPFAITFGVYGLLFHTHFKTEQEQVQQSIAWLRSRMERIFEMYEQAERSRDDDWYHEHDRLVHELTID